MKMKFIKHEIYKMEIMMTNKTNFLILNSRCNNLYLFIYIYKIHFFFNVALYCIDHRFYLHILTYIFFFFL